jgi:hypothetical protein
MTVSELKFDTPATGTVIIFTGKKKVKIQTYLPKRTDFSRERTTRGPYYHCNNDTYDQN